MSNNNREFETALSQVRSAVAHIPSDGGRLDEILQLINQFTGSQFTAVNLLDPLGRVIGGAAFPVDTAKRHAIERYGPALNILSIASPIHLEIWLKNPSRPRQRKSGGDREGKFFYPRRRLKTMPAYESVYGPLSLNNMAGYYFEPRSWGRSVLVVIARKEREFFESEVERLAAICRAFGDVIQAVKPGGLLFPAAPPMGAYQAELTKDLHAKRMSAELHALLRCFYGEPAVESGTLWVLPSEFRDDYGRHCEFDKLSVATDSRVHSFGFTRRRKGRMLLVTVSVRSDRTVLIDCREDVRSLEVLSRVLSVCCEKKLGVEFFEACVAVLDGCIGAREFKARNPKPKLRARAVKIVSEALTETLP